MEPRMTAGKAHAAGAAGALSPIVLWLLAMWTGGVDAPETAVVQQAVGVLVVSAVTGAASWLGAYFKRNFPKG